VVVVAQLNSVDQGSPQPSSASFSSLEEIMDRAYERYSLELRNVQILFSKSGTHARTHTHTNIPVAISMLQIGWIHGFLMVLTPCAET